jgi:ABC-type multidrug transport system fused ATPase/permease subunit
VDYIMQNLTGHPIIMIIVIFIGLLIVYFLFKQLLKLALLFFLILLAIGGYFYFKDPEKMPRNVMETLEKAKTQIIKTVDKGKEVYVKGKAIVEKGKKLTEGMDNILIGKEKKPDKTPDQEQRDSK